MGMSYAWALVLVLLVVHELLGLHKQYRRRKIDVTIKFKQKTSTYHLTGGRYIPNLTAVLKTCRKYDAILGGADLSIEKDRGFNLRVVVEPKWDQIPESYESIHRYFECSGAEYRACGYNCVGG